MKKIHDEAVLIFGLGLSYLLLILTTYFNSIYLLWGSLLVIVIIAVFYSITFYKSETPYQKLLYYLLTLFFLIGYFAVVYKSFGIVDSSTGDTIKPNWLNSLYFSVVTWTTLGYGDFRPTEDMKIWVMVEAIMGYIFMGLLIGKVLFVSNAKAYKKNITSPSN